MFPDGPLPASQSETLRALLEEQELIADWQQDARNDVLLADGEFALAGRAATLLAINIICVVLAAVSVFMWRGVRPRTWWEKDKARRYTRRMMILCASLVGVLVLLLLTAFSWPVVSAAGVAGRGEKRAVINVYPVRHTICNGSAG